MHTPPSGRRLGQSRLQWMPPRTKTPEDASRAGSATGSGSHAADAAKTPDTPPLLYFAGRTPKVKRQGEDHAGRRTRTGVYLTKGKATGVWRAHQGKARRTSRYTPRQEHALPRSLQNRPDAVPAGVSLLPPVRCSPTRENPEDGWGCRYQSRHLALFLERWQGAQRRIDSPRRYALGMFKPPRADKWPAGCNYDQTTSCHLPAARAAAVKPGDAPVQPFQDTLVRHALPERLHLGFFRQGMSLFKVGRCMVGG